MICEKCIKEFNQILVGQKTNNGFIAKEVKTHSKKQLFFNGYKPMFLLYIDSEKVFKNGSKKEKEVDQLFKSKFCPSCGQALHNN